MGRSECGKTTLRQALKGDTIQYHKTQYINHYDVVIDTPGEYAETNTLGRALALYSYEADVVGLVVSADDEFCIFPPACAPVANRPVIGIVTKCDSEYARKERARSWLELCGCEKVFFTSSVRGEGIDEILEYLS